jgi:hypothetical protein
MRRIGQAAADGAFRAWRWRALSWGPALGAITIERVACFSFSPRGRRWPKAG